MEADGCPLSAHRIKKLKETLVAVQQLDKNMSSLRAWLAHIESELAKPIVYDSCNSEEIQKKLQEQQVKPKTMEEDKQAFEYLSSWPGRRVGVRGDAGWEVWRPLGRSSE